jgi:hypothetical protein
MMTRREFAHRSFATLVLAGSLPALFPLAGCPTITQTQLASLIAEVGAGLAEILPYLTSVSAAAAQKIEASFQALETAVQNWKPGAVVSEIEQAVNVFVANMNLIPVLAEYQPLVALIVATAEGLLALLIPAPAGGTTTTTFAHAAPGVAVDHVGGKIVVHYQGQTVTNPPKTASAFRSAWNKQVKADSKLAGLAIT